MRWLAVSLVVLLSVCGGAAATGGVLEDLLTGKEAPGPVAPNAPQPPSADAPTATAGAAVASLALTSLIVGGTKHVTRENVLEHETRKAIHAFLWETGAAHLRRIADALDLSTTNATWHLDKLVKADLVGEVKENGYRMYYPKGGGRTFRDQCIMAAQVQSENAKAVVEYVCSNPGAHQREIARALDVNHGTARWHLSRLAEAGILEARDEGRTRTYRLTEHARDLLGVEAGPVLEGLGQPA